MNRLLALLAASLIGLPVHATPSRARATARASLRLTIQTFSSFRIYRTLDEGPCRRNAEFGLLTRGRDPRLPIEIDTVEIVANNKTRLKIPKQVNLPLQGGKTLHGTVFFIGTGWTVTGDTANWYLHLKPGSYSKSFAGPGIYLIILWDKSSALTASQVTSYLGTVVQISAEP